MSNNCLLEAVLYRHGKFQEYVWSSAIGIHVHEGYSDIKCVGVLHDLNPATFTTICWAIYTIIIHTQFHGTKISSKCTHPKSLCLRNL